VSGTRLGSKGVFHDSRGVNGDIWRASRPPRAPFLVLRLLRLLGTGLVFLSSILIPCSSRPEPPQLPPRLPPGPPNTRWASFDSLRTERERESERERGRGGGDHRESVVCNLEEFRLGLGCGFDELECRHRSFFVAMVVDRVDLPILWLACQFGGGCRRMTV
jgi:hypothetical protein